MLKNKKFIAIFVLSIVIGVTLFFIFKKASPSQAVLSSSSSSAYQEKIKQLNPASVQKVEFRAGTETLTLTKKDGVWFVNNRKAKSGYIEELFKILKPDSSPSVIAQPAKDFSEYGLAEDTATRITFDDSLTILLGEYSDKGSYARFANDSVIFDIENAASVKMDPQNWYDKSISTFDLAQVTHLSFRSDSTSISLLKKDGKWINELDNKEAKQDKVQNVLTTISKMAALVVIDETQNFTNPATLSLKITIKDSNSENTLELYPSTIDTVVHRVQDNEWFIVRDPNVSSVTTVPYDIF